MSFLSFPISTELLPWLLLLLLPPLLIIFLLRRSPKNLPPCPPRLPILGNIHQLGSLPHRTLRDLSLKYGPVITVYLGSVRTVVVHSPETAEEVLKLHDSECCTRPKLSITKSFFYDGLGLGFTQWGDYYREVRKLCVLELFSVKRANSFRNLRDEELSRLINSLSDSAASGTSVDLSGKLIKFVASFTCRMAFGLSFRGSDMDNERFMEVFTEANRVIGKFAAADIFPGFGWILDRINGLESSRRKSFRDLDTFYQKAIVDHREKKKTEEREDLIDVLLKLQSQETKLGSNRITDTHIRAILMDLFVAGVDTSAITMDWTMAELARHPRVMKKVQAEIREHVGDKGIVTYDDLESLPYMKMVLKETWRLHAPSPILIPREAMTKFKIKGYDIYPGTRIHVNAWAIGRSPDVWKDPEEFIPERFVDSNVDSKGTSYELLPFGSGRRGCPAMFVGLSTVEYSLANLLYHFDWKVTEEVSIEEAPGLTSHRKHPLHLVPVSVINRKL
ncbi:PREDICTED: cytochrome P450 71B6-like [Camelina sativa]|uniref:Cytochrome P450 71B6-like n=1 Tax=Camelina sativa TaxID=90675 RepID=A0ABM0TPM8_CAMSA|nr:PREDICTED: cytochrome P450 71B6-like [Camelina sativa]